MWATKCKLKASKQMYQNNMFPVMIVAIVQALIITNSSHTAMPNAGLCRKDNFDRNAGNLRDNSFSFFSIHAGSITISSNSWSMNRIGSKYINIKVIPFYIFVSNSAKSVLPLQSASCNVGFRVKWLQSASCNVGFRVKWIHKWLLGMSCLSTTTARHKEYSA